MIRIRLTSIIALSLILVTAFAAGGWAQKVTVDPNAPGVQRPVESKDDIDKRLAQKITYDSGYKRLHDVADDIAKLSGVSIACGKNSQDWRVRDIPLVVCVKDLPLGKLLRAVADATHTRVALERVGSDSAKHYRIYRRQREEQAIANLISARHAIKLAQVEWQWDAMTAYGKSGKEIPGVAKSLLPLGRLIAAFGPDAKAKMLDGEMFCARGSDPASAAAIGELQPAAKDTQAAAIAFKMSDEGEMGQTALCWTLRPSPNDTSGSGLIGFHFGIASALDGKGLNLPPYPKDPEVADLKDGIDNPEMAFMTKDKPEEWDYPLLLAKIDVVKPKELKDATFADAMRALAKASGCNIVAEDFVSHMAYSSQNVESAFAKDTTVADRLRGLRINGYYVQYNWFFGKDSKLLVGWASYNSGDARFSGSWLDHHRALLPEKYLTDLKRKLDGPGVQFDDAASLANLGIASYFEWFSHSRDLGCMDMLRSTSNVAMWKLYDSLSAEDKALAKSDAGLRLAKLDPGVTTEFLRSSRMSQFPLPPGPNDAQPGGVRSYLDQRATSDPNVVSTMVMKVTSTPAKRRARHVKPGSWGEGAFVEEDISAALKLSLYTLRLEYTLDGKKQTVEKWTTPDNFMTTPLPLYSLEREAEIIRAAQGRAKN